MLIQKQINSKSHYIYSELLNSFILYCEDCSNVNLTSVSWGVLMKYYLTTNIICFDKSFDNFVIISQVDNKLTSENIYTVFDYIQKNNYLEKFEKYYKISTVTNPFNKNNRQIICLNRHYLHPYIKN